MHLGTCAFVLSCTLTFNLTLLIYDTISNSNLLNLNYLGYSNTIYNVYIHINVFFFRKNSGEKSYLIPVGGSNVVGAWGYLSAFNELLEQVRYFLFSFVLFPIRLDQYDKNT